MAELCVNCGKCTAGCPALIGVPKYIRAYQMELFPDNIISDGKPMTVLSAAIARLRCPQKIKVLAVIRELAMRYCGKSFERRS